MRARAPRPTRNWRIDKNPRAPPALTPTSAPAQQTAVHLPWRLTRTCTRARWGEVVGGPGRSHEQTRRGRAARPLHTPLQLAVYGRESMRRMAAANVLVCGLRGLGVEVGERRARGECSGRGRGWGRGWGRACTCIRGMPPGLTLLAPARLSPADYMLAPLDPPCRLQPRT